jgi:hypothetical protein
MSNTDAEGKRNEAPPPGDARTDDEAGAGAPSGGAAVPPQRSSDRPGEGGIDEAAEPGSE